MNREDWKAVGLKIWGHFKDDWLENVIIAFVFYTLGHIVGKFM